MVQFEDILVAQAFNVFCRVWYLLEVLVLAAIEYGIVDNDSVNLMIFVCIDQMGLEFVTIFLSELVRYTTTQ